jgi:chromosome segregation ATPase
MKKTRKKLDDVKTVDTVKTLQAAGVVNEIGNLQVTVQTTLANISAAITGKLEQLHNVESAIGTLEDRLNEVYQIEKEALSLEEIKAARADEQARFDKMIAARNQEWTEDEAERAKEWHRKEEEHNYDVLQKRKRFADEFNAEVEGHKRAERIRTDELTKAWAARETEIATKEAEVVNLKKEAEGFEAKMKAEISKAESIATNSVKKQYEHQMQLLQKDMESERNMSNSKIQSLQIQVGQLVDQIKDLNVQLLSARTDAKEVTAQALQSASGRQVAEALSRVVDSGKDGKTK